MQKFRKKPVVIEAEQFREAHTPWPEGVKNMELGGVDEDDVGYTYKGPGVNTLEGPHAVSEGDWIIKGLKGELYPCKPDIFELSYDAEPDALEETDVTLKSLMLRAMNGGGRLISSNDLREAQIADARADGRMAVIEDGTGWVLLPWSRRTAQEAARDGAADPDKFAS